MRSYAQDTKVPVAESRQEIDELLRSWGADGVQWTDDWRAGGVMLRFIWPDPADKTVRYQARFRLQLPTEEQIRKSPEVRNKQTRQLMESRVQLFLQRRGMHEHRILLLWLKAAFNAVRAGLVKAEAIFLPFLEDVEGVTVAERALPQLSKLLSASADRLLPAPGGGHG